MKKIFLFFVFQLLAFALHAQTFTFNMYDANDESKKITVTVNTSSQKVSIPLSSPSPITVITSTRRKTASVCLPFKVAQ